MARSSRPRDLVQIVCNVAFAPYQFYGDAVTDRTANARHQRAVSRCRALTTVPRTAVHQR